MRREPGPRSRRLLLIGAVVVLAGAALAAGVAALVSHPAPGGKAAAVGKRRFERAAATCAPIAQTAHPGSAGAGPALVLGISASLRLEQGPARCEQARLAAATGVQAVREDIGWAETEPQPGRYDWSHYDAVVRAASQAGLVVLPILDDAPPWAAPSKACLPSDPAGYASFAAATVARYGPGGSYWQDNPDLPARPLVWYELWNEPWNADCHRDPAAYARLVVSTVSAGRAANPAARFLIGGDTFYDTDTGTRADWIAGMYAAVPDLGRYFDALSIHPYGGDPSVYTPGGDTDGQPGRLAQAHAELAAHGDGDKPLWVTEIGWSTCAGTSGCVTESQQASYLASFLRSSITTWRSYVRAVFVYDLRDFALNPRDNREAWFGLLRPDLSRKPAWSVLRTFADALRSS